MLPTKGARAHTQYLGQPWHGQRACAGVPTLDEEDAKLVYMDDHGLCCAEIKTSSLELRYQV